MRDDTQLLPLLLLLLLFWEVTISSLGERGNGNIFGNFYFTAVANLLVSVKRRVLFLRPCSTISESLPCVQVSFVPEI